MIWRAREIACTHDSILGKVGLEVALVKADGKGRDVKVVARVVSARRGTG